MLTRDIGTPSGDMKQDINTIYDYIAYLTEQLEYSNRLLEKRVKALEKEEA
ncbi:MAG: hypothetical protein J6Q14_06345 [Oscillospiraceae bacterium]|nr:hypothetical protein [Oscillospiraceae bacterium]